MREGASERIRKRHLGTFGEQVERSFNAKQFVNFLVWTNVVGLQGQKRHRGPLVYIYYMKGDTAKRSISDTICVSFPTYLRRYAARTVPIQLPGRESHNLVTADIRIHRRARRKRRVATKRVTNLSVVNTKLHKDRFQSCRDSKLRRIQLTASSTRDDIVALMEMAYLETVQETTPSRVQRNGGFILRFEKAFKKAKKVMQQAYRRLCENGAAKGSSDEKQYSEAKERHLPKRKRFGAV